MTSTAMRKHSRSAIPLPVAAVVVIIGLLIRPTFSFVVVANDSRRSFQSPVMTSTSSSTAASPLYMTFTMPVMPKLDFNAPSAANNGAIWYESCVDPKARLPDYNEDVFAGDYVSFSSPSLDWPSAIDIMEATSDATSHQEPQAQRRRPIRAVRRAAGRVLGVIPRLMHLSF